MISDVAMENAARLDLNNDKDIDYAEGCANRREEIAGHNGIGVVQNECRPALIATWRARLLAQILADCSWGNVDAKLEQQFIGDAFLAPRCIFAIQLLDDLPEVIQ